VTFRRQFQVSGELKVYPVKMESLRSFHGFDGAWSNGTFGVSSKQTLNFPLAQSVLKEPWY
jgi:hypothetical protein